MARTGNIIFVLGCFILRSGEILFVLLLLLLIPFCVYVLVDAQIVVNSADLPEEISILAPKEKNGVDFSALRAINEDIVGWISIDDTGINYPVLQGENNEYYLARDYTRQWATSGSIFIDYRNEVDLSDVFSIIYGHRMGYGKMFSDIALFQNGNYFASHTIGNYYIGDEKYTLRVVSFALVSATEQKIYDVSHSKDDMSTVQFVYDRSKWRNGVLPEGRFVLLSTCDASDRSMRDVLLMHVE